MTRRPRRPLRWYDYLIAVPIFVLMIVLGILVNAYECVKYDILDYDYPVYDTDYRNKSGKD